MKKLLAVIGTRPEAVKLCPLILELQKRKQFRVRVLYTGQHGRICSDVFRTYGVYPDRSFLSMRDGASPDAVAGKVLEETGKVLTEECPDAVVVQGDTTTAFAVALCAFYRKIPVIHVEAGLRTYDFSAPFPEEMHRRLTAFLTTLHFAPTESAAVNLRREGVPPEAVYTVGNTVTDALLASLRKEDKAIPLSFTNRIAGKRLILATLHRRENVREIPGILQGLRDAVAAYPDVYLLCEAHPNPDVLSAVSEALNGCANAEVSRPLPVEAFHRLLARAYLVVTDSGGIQEEAAFLGVPTLVTRCSTERPEALGCGVLQVCGTDGAVLRKQVERLIRHPEERDRMAVKTEVYGDGQVSGRIADILEAEFKNHSESV